VTPRVAAAFAFAVALAALATRDARADESPPRFALGARAGMQSLFLEGDGSPSDLRGMFVGMDGSVRVTRHLALAAVVEASEYAGRGDRLPAGPIATSWGAFLEARADTNPGGPLSVRIDVGPGYRWLTLPVAAAPADHFSGFEPLRVHVGPSWRVAGQTEIALLGGAGFGWFATQSFGRACSVTATCADSLFGSDTVSSAHFVLDVSLAIRGWP
jgi:putative component of toxin-antitoxin plasmid stabilization module